MRVMAVFVLLLAAQDTDTQKIQGEWQCTSLVDNGEKLKLSVGSKLRLTITDKTFRQHRFQVDLETFPYLGPDGLMQFHVGDAYFMGLYELKGDRLKRCYPGPLEAGKEPQPPAGFESKKGSKQMLSTWDRVKE